MSRFESPEFDIYKDPLYVGAVKMLAEERKLYPVPPSSLTEYWAEKHPFQTFTYLWKYPFQTHMWTKHPFFRMLTEADHLKIQSDARRDLDAMKKRKMEETAAKTAAENRINHRLRSNLGNLLYHYNDLLTEVNRITDEEDKAKYLQGQCLILQKACVMLGVLRSFQKEEITLNNQLLNNRQLLAVVESRLADLDKIDKEEEEEEEEEEKSWSLHHVSAARPVTIAAFAAVVITALLKWRARSFRQLA